MRRSVRLSVRPLAWMTCVLAFATPLFAQTHPCDVAPVQGQVLQTNSTVAVGFCQPNKDADGNTIPIASITSYRVVVDNGTVFTGALTPIGSASASGLYYFETPKNIPISKGGHVAVVYPSNDGGEGAGSDPLSFTVKNVPPGKGRVQAVIK